MTLKSVSEHLDTTLPEHSVVDQLSRILDSPTFSRARHSSDFLRYVVEETLAGRSAGLKGYTIAIDVLGRRESFDATVSPVVRVEAGRLRQRLDEYYRTDGKDDPIEISLPRGIYVPRFRTLRRPSTEPPPVLIDTRIGTLGRYLLLERIGDCGEGGAVYRAEDTRLLRPVAVKLVPKDSAEALIREARAAALLEHDNICAVLDAGETSEYGYIVTALLEGATLESRIAEGPLPMHDVVEIVEQVAAGLAEAHRHGVVHCDVKPGNILIEEDTGRVALVNFGIAQANYVTGPRATSENDGTRAYMSPEQIRGEDVDGRKDLWSLGVVLYEALTGRLPFSGESSSALAVAILEQDPAPLEALENVGRDARAALEHVIGTCLAKDPLERYATAEDLLKDLGPLARRRDRGAKSRRLHRWIAAVATLAVAIVVALVLRDGSRVRPSGDEVRRFSISTGHPAITAPRISPNGFHLAYLSHAYSQDRYQSFRGASLWVRELATDSAWQIGRADSPPCWSPDSAQLAYVLDGGLYVSPASGGTPRRLDVTLPLEVRTCTWSPDKSSVFVAITDNALDTRASGAWEIPVDGGERRVHPWPVEMIAVDALGFVPHHAKLILLLGRPNRTQFLLVDLTEGTLVLEHAGTNPTVSPDGRVFYLDRGALKSRVWSPDGMELVDEETVVTGPTLSHPSLDDIRSVLAQKNIPLETEVLSHPSVADDGAIVFLEGVALNQVMVVDRSGSLIEPVGSPWPIIREPNLSPDETMVASNARRDGVRIHDMGRGVSRYVPSTAANTSRVVWSPDSRSLARHEKLSDQKEALFIQPVSGRSAPTEILRKSLRARPQDWSSDGAHILFQAFTPETRRDLWVVSRNSDGTWLEPKPFLETPAREDGAVFSPDVRYVLYCSDVSGRREVYARTFPDAENIWQVSSNGGSQPRWSGNGREIFYVEKGTLVAVPVRTVEGLELGRAERLFRHPVLGAHMYSGAQYDVSADGQRFVVVARVQDPEIRVLLNWHGAPDH